MIARAFVLAAMLLFASALAPSCAPVGSPLAISYLTAWDDAGATVDADETWSTITDRGFVVHVLDASITTYAVTLVPCDATESAMRWIAPPIAYAGHLEHPDASMIEPNFTEAIAPGAARAIGSTEIVTTTRYCRAHQLVGGRVDLTTETPTRLPSLTLALDVTDAAGTPVRTVDLATTIATGTLGDLPAARTDADAITVTWHRPLARLFDGIAWDDASLTSAQIAQAVLLTIAAQSHAEVEWSPSR